MSFAENLAKLKTGKTKNFANFLKEAKCAKNAKELKAYLDSDCTKVIESCNTIEKFDKTKSKAYKCVKLTKPKKSPFKPLSDYLISYIDALIE